MQRSKQQALMFLLGALLVGGVVGASAIKVMDKKPQRVPARVQMYDDIGIDSALRVKMDSVLDETNCKTAEIMRAMRPSLDSVQAEGFKTLVDMMTPAQHAAFEARRKRMRERMDSTEKAHDAEWAKNHPGADRNRRCGVGGPRGGTGGQPDRGSPHPFL
jgi:hypothetical protein